MQMNISRGRYGHARRFIKRALHRSLVGPGLAVSLLVLPGSGGAFTATLPALVASATAPDTPDYAQKTCPPTLSDGARGDYVVYLQDLLSTALRPWGMEPLVPDGVFGAKTKGYVMQVQGHARIEQDGIVGPRTWRVLNAC
jgi:peptidoglycan hydrolase-like protein with peptidoglycan-binding domain